MNKNKQPICEVSLTGTKRWILNGQYHRLDGPAMEDINGTRCWFLHGKLHRLDGPAIEYNDGTKRWFYHGKRIRCSSQKQFEKLIKNMKINKDNQPVCQIGEDGTKRWTLNNLLHRLDGPAIEYTDGDKYWYFHGQFHREDGPAVEYNNGNKSWYYHGELINCSSQKDFERLIKNIKNKNNLLKTKDKTLTLRSIALIKENRQILLKKCDGTYLHQWTNIAAGPDNANWTTRHQLALEFFNLEWAFAIAPLYDCKVVSRKRK